MAQKSAGPHCQTRNDISISASKFRALANNHRWKWYGLNETELQSWTRDILSSEPDSKSCFFNVFNKCGRERALSIASIRENLENLVPFSNSVPIYVICSVRSSEKWSLTLFIFQVPTGILHLSTVETIQPAESFKVLMEMHFAFHWSGKNPVSLLDLKAFVIKAW